MKKIFLLISLILSFAVFGFGQEADKLIEYYPNQAEGSLTKDENNQLVPTTEKGLELIGIFVEGKLITFGKSFTAGDDWLKTLTVKLKNVSGKPISSVRMSFSRPEAKFKDSSLGFSLEFGSLSGMVDNRATKKIIQPDEEFELTQTEAQYFRGKAFMLDKTGVAIINKLIIGMTMVQFEDGNLWATRKIPSVK